MHKFLFLFCFFATFSNQLDAQALSDIAKFDLQHSISDDFVYKYWFSEFSGIRNSPESYGVGLEQKKIMDDLMRPIIESYDSETGEFLRKNEIPNVVNQIYELIGPLPLMLVVQSGNRSFIENQLRHFEANITGTPLDCFLVDSVQKYLGMKSEEMDEFKKMLIGFRKELDVVNGKFADEILEINQRRFDALVNQLSPEIRGQVKAIVGKPIDWFRLKESLTIHSSSNRENLSKLSPRVNELAEKAGIKNSFMASKNELEDAGIVCVDPIFYRLIRDDVLLGELELTKYQLQQLVETRQGKWAELEFVRPDFAKDRLVELLKPNAELPKDFGDFLLDEQKRWIVQLELQLHLVDDRSTVGLAARQICEKFSIAEKTRNILMKIGKEFDELEKRSLNEMNSIIDDKKAEINNKLQKTLGAKRYDLLINLLGPTG